MEAAKQNFTFRKTYSPSSPSLGVFFVYSWIVVAIISILLSVVVTKWVLPSVQVGVHIINPESCEIDAWVMSNIDFLTFELDALRDKVRDV